ncbi:MAG: hypothetical protein COB02_05180 [Candidatus Cloacimonadota bacterium]|nr:MAG: hypothetical protein COB02_05180 [Candidatus Cloacimonadota bacterium]
MSAKQTLEGLGFTEDTETDLFYGYRQGHHELVLLNQEQSNGYLVSFVSVFSNDSLSIDLFSLLKKNITFFDTDLEKSLNICKQEDYKVRLSNSMHYEQTEDEILSLSILIEGVFDIEALTKFLPSLKLYYTQYCQEIDLRLDAILFGDF